MHIFCLVSRIQALLLCLALAFLAGCVTTPFADRYDPGAEYVTLWGDEGFSVDQEWQLLGTEKITVRGEAWNAIIAPVDEIQTMLFVRKSESFSKILLVSRVVKPGHQTVFRPLGGHKTRIDERLFREQIFGLDSSTNNPEYRRYLELLRTSAIPLAPNYTVRVLDRLPLETVLIRSMELTPGEASEMLPSYAALYPQEVNEQLRIQDFRP